MRTRARMENEAMKLHWIAFLTLSFLTMSCSQDKTEPAQTKEPEVSPPPAETSHASADVVPGSYEDWCGEHQVPESACTRCDPSLIPAFQATNDWCAEHGLPESQCLKCNPDLKIVRPPKPQGT